MSGRPAPRLLVFNCHEAWIAQLEATPYAIDVVVGLPGRVSASWDTRARPLPANGRLVSLEDAGAAGNYDCVIVHNPADLLAARRVDAPRLFVVHNTLEGRLVEEGSGAHAPGDIRAAFLALLARTAAHAVAISPLKAASWCLSEGDLYPGIDVEAFGPHLGTLPRGLRVVNQARFRSRILRWDLHAAALAGLPVTIVGYNPGIRDAGPARSFQHLKDLYRVHRVYVHTADPELEDGYNLAMLEAMASGLPVLGNIHPSSPIEHGVSGYLADDPAALAEHARELLADPARAAAMGRAARETVRARFPVDRFVQRFVSAVETARATWQGAQARCA